MTTHFFECARNDEMPVIDILNIAECLVMLVLVQNGKVTQRFQNI